MYAADFVEPEAVKDYRKNFVLASFYTPEFYLNDLPNFEFKDPELILSQIQNIYNALKTQNEKLFLREVTKGTRLWSIGLKKKKIIEFKLKKIKEYFFSNPDLKVIEFKLNNVRIIWGERTAMVYSGFRKIMDHKEPHLFKCNIAEETLFYPPVYFVYVENKWIIWN